MAELTVDMTYGNALFQVAREMNCVAEMKKELLAIDKVFKETQLFLRPHRRQGERLVQCRLQVLKGNGNVQGLAVSLRPGLDVQLDGFKELVP